MMTARLEWARAALRHNSYRHTNRPFPLYHFSVHPPGLCIPMVNDRQSGNQLAPHSYNYGGTQMTISTFPSSLVCQISFPDFLPFSLRPFNLTIIVLGAMYFCSNFCHILYPRFVLAMMKKCEIWGKSFNLSSFGYSGRYNRSACHLVI